ASYGFKHGFSLPIRWEYIASSGSAAQNSVNLMYGPGSTGTTFTLTPTFQQGGFFARGDIAWTHIGSYVPGAVFGPKGLDNNQFRVAGEIGFIFGENIKKPCEHLHQEGLVQFMTTTLLLAPADKLNAY